ncbi:MAG: acyltransferase [Muribaculaceae bacterium]|nr:acyltransferase [Muribaculaceae bacterium]
MTDTSQLFSKAFSLLRLPLALMVVAIHSRPFYSALTGDTWDTYSLQLDAVLAVLNVAVPVFFFISGWLFFRNGATLTTSDWLSKLRRRSTTLLLPYIMGNLLFLMFALLKKFSPLAAEYPHYADFSLLSFETLKGFIHTEGTPYPHVVPLWFLRNLMFAVLLTPVISRLLRAWAPLPPLIFAAMAVIFAREDTLTLCQTLLWFSLGAAVCVSPGVHGLFRHWAVIPIGLILLTAGVAMNLSVIGPMSKESFVLLYTFGGIIMAIGIALHAASAGLKAPALSGELSFFIYVVHGHYSSYARKLIGTFMFPSTISGMWVTHIADTLFIAAFTLAIFLVMRRWFPGWFWILGARNIAPRPSAATQRA